MSYASLYRKFRPLKFDEIVGQDHIVRTLKNQIINNRVGHAYLFNGGRGTGKTTAAKILARALNCLNVVDGEPCNECEICKGMLNGSLTDFVEMDAASNNGVEDIRQIRETVNFLPAQAKYRVYIIDEVHMLSVGAFNALLKTLEEPPAHVKFILATTEPQKIPATILSRCQRFDFKKIDDKYIVDRLKFISQESKIKISEDALKLIATLSDGGMRDAISILERCSEDNENNITENIIRELMGIPKFEQISSLVDNIINYNVNESIRVCEDIIASGKDIVNMLWEIIKYIRDLLIYKIKGDIEIYNSEEKNVMDNISKKVSCERLIKIIKEMSILENELKWSNQKSIIFESAMISLSTNLSCSGYEEIEKKLISLDEIIRSGKFVQNVDNIEKNMIKSGEIKKKNENILIKEENKENNSLNKKDFIDWKSVVEDLKKEGKLVLYTNLVGTTAIELNDMTVGIEFKKGITPFAKAVLENNENMQYLIKKVSIMYGKEMHIKLIDNKQIDTENNGNNNIPFDIIN